MGKGCDKIENIIDEIAYKYEKDSGNYADNTVVVTTSHKNEPIEEALWYFLNCTIPAEYYELTLNSSLAISIGNENYYSIIHDVLSNPKLLEKNILD